MSTDNPALTITDALHPRTSHEVLMAIGQPLCSALDQARDDHETYVRNAIRVGGGQRVEPLPGSNALFVLRFEVIHDDPICRRTLADSCVLVSAHDPDIRFVAPDDDAADNYVSYWHREPTSPREAPWAVLSGGQRSNTSEVRILGQTLPAQIAEQGGAGHLAYVQDLRPGDGWTVSVGITHLHLDDAADLTTLDFDVTVSARPDWNPETPAMQLHVAEQ